MCNHRITPAYTCPDSLLINAPNPMLQTHSPFICRAAVQARPPHMPSAPITTISHAAFLEHIARTDGGIFAAWNGNVWRIEVIDGMTLKLLSQPGTGLTATFNCLNDVADHLLALGIAEYSVVLDEGTREPDDYADWLRAAAIQALREANDPTTAWVSHEASNDAADRLISELMAKIAARDDEQ
ncbi:hypothetical protein PIN31009_04813 [Pandoraea iniqua]|nr:hypothetical protein PIN31009_04813 [Pandoraea iniqua]